MASYLLVVGLVFLPSFLYLRVFQREELRRRAATELVSEARIIGDRIHVTPQERLEPTLAELARLVPQHFTVIRADGEVLVDSLASPPYVNQRMQPEVKEALYSPEGIGEAVRTRDGTSLSYLQVAVRYPRRAAASAWSDCVATATLDAATRAAQASSIGACARASAAVILRYRRDRRQPTLKGDHESARAFAAATSAIRRLRRNDELATPHARSARWPHSGAIDSCERRRPGRVHSGNANDYRSRHPLRPEAEPFLIGGARP